MTHSIIQVSDPKTEKNLAKATRTFITNYLSPNTQKAYLTDFRDFGDFLTANFPNVGDPKSITMDHVIHYREELRAKYSPTTINRKLSALSALFRDWKEKKIVDDNPVLGVRRPEAIIKKEGRGFSDKEADLVCSHYSTETLQGLNNRTLLTFLFFTGCRVSEAVTIKVKDLRQEKGIWIIHFRGKGDKLRNIEIHPKLLTLLLELIARRSKGPQDFIFTRVRGIGSSHFARQSVFELVKKTCDAIGIDSDRSCHSTRRTVASHLLEKGEPMERVQKLLGHRDPKTTQKYQKRAPKREDSAAFRIHYSEKVENGE